MTDDERLERILQKHKAGYKQYLLWLNHQLSLSLIRLSDKQEGLENDNKGSTQ